jgi:hypothetical protein
MQERVTELEESQRSMQERVTELEESRRSMQDTIYSMQVEKLNLYIGNMLVDFIKKICQSRGLGLPSGAGNDPSHSTTRYAQAAQRIGRKDLSHLGIPPKYYEALQNFPKVYTLRPGLRAKLTR